MQSHGSLGEKGSWGCEGDILGEGDVKITAKIKPKNAKDCWQAPEARRGRKLILPQSLWREPGSTHTSMSDFWKLKL